MAVRAAPEVLRGEGYGRHTDWWSLGNLVCQMLFGSVRHTHARTHTHTHTHARTVRSVLTRRWLWWLSADGRTGALLLGRHDQADALCHGEAAALPPPHLQARLRRRLRAAQVLHPRRTRALTSPLSPSSRFSSQPTTHTAHTAHARQLLGGEVEERLGYKGSQAVKSHPFFAGIGACSPPGPLSWQVKRLSNTPHTPHTPHTTRIQSGMGWRRRRRSRCGSHHGMAALPRSTRTRAGACGRGATSWNSTQTSPSSKAKDSSHPPSVGTTHAHATHDTRDTRHTTHDTRTRTRTRVTYGGAVRSGQD